MKRIKYIEGKNEQQLDLIRDQGEKQLDLIGKINTDKAKKIGFYDKNKQAVALVYKINKIIRENKNKKFVCTNSNGTTNYDFNRYRDLNQFGSEIYNKEITLDEAKNEQHEMSIDIVKFRVYGPTSSKKPRQEVLDNAKSFML